MALLGCAPSSILKSNNTQFLDLVDHKRSCYRAWLRSGRNRQYMVMLLKHLLPRTSKKPYQIPILVEVLDEEGRLLSGKKVKERG